MFKSFMDEFTPERPQKPCRTPQAQLARVKDWKRRHPDLNRKHVREATLRWKYRNLDKVRKDNRECAARIRMAKYLEEALESMKSSGRLVLHTPQRLQALTSSDRWEEVVNYATQHSIDLSAPKFVKAC